jgi:hypothetical protein
MEERTDYTELDKQEREDQLGSRNSVVGKTWATDLWVRVVQRAVEDLITFKKMRAAGKIPDADDLLDEESAIGFLFDDDYTIPMDDYQVKTSCPKCGWSKTGMMSDLVGHQLNCEGCKAVSKWKTVVCEIVEGQNIPVMSLAELLSIWDVDDIDGFRQGVLERCEREMGELVEPGGLKYDCVAEEIVLLG